MIKAIAFDCFGVLTESKWRIFRAKLDPEVRSEVTEVHRAYDRGFISYSDFQGRLVQLTGASKSDLDNIFVNRAGYHKNAKLLELIAELKRSYKIAIISNVGSNWLRDKLLTPEEVSLFDVFVLSYEVGLAKPDPEMYQIAYSRLDIEPHELIFVDDKPEYTRAADALGIHGITYTEFVQFKSDLDRLLADSND